jgi:DNA ligase-1
MNENFLKLASKNPDGLEEDSRIIKLGLVSKYYWKPVGSFSAYPEKRAFTLGASQRVKTPNAKILKAEDANKRPNTKIKGWVMSEKLDGLRWVWDGAHFITTSGSVPFYVPDWIKELMPIGVPLDGELFFQRDGFNEVTGISNTKPGGKYSQKDLDLKWLNFSFNVFDAPGSSERFEQRLDLLKQVVDIRGKFWPEIRKKYYKILKKTDPEKFKKFKKLECPLKFVEQIKIKDEEHLSEYFTKIVELKGEGLIVRDHRSFYENGRRPKIALKYKKHADAEAIIIDVLPTDKEGSRLDYLVNGPDNSEYQAMGKILCKLTDSQGQPIKHNGNDVIFKIGTGFSDEQRDNYCNPESKHYIFNPITKQSAIITFGYMEFNKDNGVPRLPRFHRIRHQIINKNKNKDKLVPNIPKTGSELKYRLIRDFRVVTLVAQNRGPSLKGSQKMSNTFRIRTYDRNIEILETMDDNLSFEKAVSFLKEFLTKACVNKLITVIEKGIIQLDKEPYNGVTVINGIVSDPELQSEIEAVITMEPLLNAKVGIGSNLLQQLIGLGYNDIDSLENFQTDKRISPGLKKALTKYFDGSIRTVPRMSRDEAKEWRKSLNKKMKPLKSDYKNLKYKMCGSYARKSETIGDIDYVIVNDGTNQDLYNIMMFLLKDLEKEFIVDSKLVYVEKEEIPKASKGYKDQLHMMLRLTKEGSGHKRKLEVYGYSSKKQDYLFAFLDRTASVPKQKEMRWKAHKLGLSLSGRGFKFRQSGIRLKPGDKLIQDHLNKDYFDEVDDVYNFVGVLPNRFLSNT